MLPRPKRWKASQEWLAIAPNIKIRRPGRPARTDPSEFGRVIEPALAGLLARLGDATAPADGRKCVKQLELHLVDRLDDPPDGRASPEAYQLTIGAESIRLCGTDAPALRAGLVSLGQLIQTRQGLGLLRAGQMTDWPDLPLRGFHLDLSCQTLSFEYVCSLLARLADYKYNAVLVEWGDKFPYQGHRDLSHPDAFSQRQVSQFLELADSLGVVVIPLIQTLGHVEFILRHSQFAHLSEVPGDVYQLATSNPESLVLAKQLVDQIIESHPNSPYIHLGADETTQLGQGVSAEQVQRKGKSLVWVEYMNVICRHVQARGRTPIVWDDILLGYPQALHRFTRDCLLMHWNYGATAPVAEDYHQPGVGRINAKTYRQLDVDLRGRYDRFWALGGAKPPRTFYTAAPVAYLREAGFQVVQAPAVRSFGDSYAAPRLGHHIDNCFQMARAAAEHGCLGLLVTNWSVRRCPLETTVPGLIAAAEAAWNANSRPAKGLDGLLAEQLTNQGGKGLLAALEAIGQSGLALFNGVGPGSAWDRRHQRWGIAPLLGRLRKAELASLSANSPPVRLARAAQRDAKAAWTRLGRASSGPRMHPSFLAAWRYAARETAHKAGQWQFLWRVCRFIQSDQGSPAELARQGVALLEEMRRCQRDFKRSVGPSLASSGVEEELDVRFGGEGRLIRRVVRTLRAPLGRGEQRSQLADMLAMSTVKSADKQ